MSHELLKSLYTFEKEFNLYVCNIYSFKDILFNFHSNSGLVLNAQGKNVCTFDLEAVTLRIDHAARYFNLDPNNLDNIPYIEIINENCTVRFDCTINVIDSKTLSLIDLSVSYAFFYFSKKPDRIIFEKNGTISTISLNGRHIDGDFAKFLKIKNNPEKYFNFL